jgi:hypothetical protein
MEYSYFITLLLGYKKFSEDITSLYELGFDLMGGRYCLTSPVELMLTATIKSHYGKEGWEWVEWFIWESDYGQKDFSTTRTYQQKEDGTTEVVESKPYGAYDENGNPICHSYESLWNYLEKNHKQTLKQ